MANVKFPDRLSFLFEPKRYKVIRGGRGSAKSWSVARALLIKGTKEPDRKSVVEGKSVEHGGCRRIKKKKNGNGRT